MRRSANRAVEREGRAVPPGHPKLPPCSRVQGRAVPQGTRIPPSGRCLRAHHTPHDWRPVPGVDPRRALPMTRARYRRRIQGHGHVGPHPAASDRRASSVAEAVPGGLTHCIVSYHKLLPSLSCRCPLLVLHVRVRGAWPCGRVLARVCPLFRPRPRPLCATRLAPSCFVLGHLW